MEEHSSRYKGDFLGWIGCNAPKLLASDKFDRFKQLMTFPIETTELTQRIYSNLARVFKAQDRNFEYKFIDEKYSQDWDAFRDDSFWETEFWDAVKYYIDSVIVISWPEIQVTEFPAPISIIIKPTDFIHIDVDNKNNIQLFMFKQIDPEIPDEFKLFVYTPELIQRWSVKEQTLSPSTGVEFVFNQNPDIEVTHGLGYTPAKMIWSDNLQGGNNVNKTGPLTNNLSRLNWLLVHRVNKKYMGLANSYPIIAKYKDSDSGMFRPNPEGSEDPENIAKTPAGHGLNGAGTMIEVDPPIPGATTDLMQNIVKIISPPVDTLKYHDASEEALESYIFNSIVGHDQQLSRTAVNELQVISSFESRKDVLMHIGLNIELIRQFCEETICKIRYAERFESCSISYGSEHYLKGVSDLYSDLEEAKKAGASLSILESINSNIINTQFHNNSDAYTKAKIIDDLDPFPGLTIQEVSALYTDQGLDDFEFNLKVHLVSWVRRFEREQSSIITFAAAKEYKDKIKLILDEFEKYYEEIKPTEVKQPGTEIVAPVVVTKIDQPGLTE